MWYAAVMTKTLKDALARTENWPEWAQDNLADIAREIDREIQAGTYRATEDELRKIDEALAAVRRGETATDAEVEAVFAKHRGA
jgi:RNA polymerase-binding transcription factor DksA